MMMMMVVVVVLVVVVMVILLLLFYFLLFWVLVLLTLTETITGLYLIFFLWRIGPIPDHGLPLRVFAITLRSTTLRSTPVDECSVRRRDLYLTTRIIHNRHSFPTAGFGPTIPASGRPQTQALDRAATWLGLCLITS